MGETGARAEAQETVPARRGKGLLHVGLFLLTATALYLLGPGWGSMDGPMVCALFVHIGLGLLLLIPAALRLSTHIEKAGTRSARGAFWLLFLLAGVCALTGLLLLARPVLGQSNARQEGARQTHTIVGLLAFAGYAVWRLVLWRQRFAAARALPSNSRIQTALLLILLLVGPGALLAATQFAPYDADTYFRDLTATNATQAQNPLFPAGTRRADAMPIAPDETVLSDSYCGRTGCHANAYHEWQSSTHHFAASDPFYQRVAGEYAVRAGEKAVRWCEGCHAPSRVAFARTDAHAGVDCVSCHAAAGTPDRTGNGRLTFSTPHTYPFANAASNGWPRRLHDFLMRLRPGPHQREFLTPALHNSPDFCASCHRESFNVAQNHYQFVAGPDHFGEWQSGPFSGRSAQTSGQSAQPPQTCQSCHFPKDVRGHASHAALGANTLLPALRNDADRLRATEEFLRAGRLTLDIFALQRKAGANQPQRLVAPLDAPLDESVASLRPGETVLLDVVAANRSIGHGFPSGYDDIKDAWVEMTLRDGRGRLLGANGLLKTEDAPLPSGIHAYRAVPLDVNGNPLRRHDLTDMATEAYRRQIASGSSDIARYRLAVPRRGPDGLPLVGPLRLTARLRFRALRPDFARWAVADSRVSVPVTTLAEAVLSLPLLTASSSKPISLPRVNGVSQMQIVRRFLRYGDGLLAPTATPDLPDALRAFQRARQLASDLPDVWIGLGRTYLAQSALLAARAQFEEALRLSPGHPAARAYLGLVARRQGEYDLALRLLKPLAAQFPRDAALQSDLGLTLLQSSDFEGAAQAFERALAADPNDATAHYELKRCYQHLRRVAAAREEEVIGRYLAEDRLAPRLLPHYRQTDPDARAAGGIPIHVLN